MWGQWKGVRMLNCFVLRLSCLCRDHVYGARLRGELPGFKVTKWAHLDQDSHDVLWTTGKLSISAAPYATTWTCRPFLETAACSCCNMTQLVTCITCLKQVHANILHVIHARWGMLAWTAAFVDTSAIVDPVLPRRCQQQLAKWAPGQPAWLPCLWMALLSKVAVRTLERSAINTPWN